jgi:hypothetical protein
LSLAFLGSSRFLLFTTEGQVRETFRLLFA